jgi:general secretion pathway protein D
MRKTNRFCMAVLVAALAGLSGCETTGDVYSVPRPVIAAGAGQPGPAEETPLPGDVAGETQARAGFERLSPLAATGRGLAQDDGSKRFPDDDEIRVAVEDMPLSQFLHYAFGELLGVNYLVADGLENLEAPVTLNLQDSVSSRRLYSVATELLAGREVGVTYRDEIYYLHPVDRRGKGDVFIGFGARPEDVPEVPGPIMQVIPLRYGLSVSLERTLRDLVDAKVVGDPVQGAVFVTGERFEIQRVLDVVGLMDQPAQRGRYIGLVSLTYITIDEFMDRIVELLSVEGVPAGIGAGASNSGVALVSLESLGAVAVFAAARQHLDRVDYWARQIDRPARGAERRYYIYTPRYARADELGESLVPLLGGSDVAGVAAGSEPRDTRSALGSEDARSAVDAALQPRRDDRRGSSAGSAREPVSVRAEDLTMSVDLRSNALIFNTTGTRYQALLPMIRRLDTPPRQVLLEATIAEVLLTDEFALGVEFALESGDTSLGTTGGLGLPEGGGFISVIGNDGAIRAQLSASNRLVNVLSNPSLVVRDGVSASISVGNDIPTVGATFFDPIQSDTQITTVQYRKTGVNLTVRPTINAQGLVVMEIDQDISNTVEGGSDVEGAPAIFERSLSTEVVARSGETVLLGGLIAENNNDTVAKVPFLGDIPWLGRLFRSETQTTERTELVVMITPQVLDESTRWDSILNRLDSALRHLSLDASATGTQNSGENATE